MSSSFDVKFNCFVKTIQRSLKEEKGGQVYSLKVAKLYATKDGRPGMDLRLAWNETQAAASVA